MTDQLHTRAAVALTATCLVIPPALAAGGWLGAYPGRAALVLLFLPPFLLSHGRGWRGGVAGVAVSLAALLAAALVGGPAVRPDAAALGGLLLVVGSAASLSAGVLHRSRIAAEERALSDPGTGLPNRRHGLLHLERAFAAARRGTELAVVMFDLDRFKRVNDEHGHAAGDEVLRQFARVLHARTREMNLSARMGGEEFASILESCDAEGARLFAEGIRSALAEVHFPFGRVTVSAGIATYEPGMASPDVILAAADQALYRAKAGGRDRVEVAGRAPAGGRGPLPLARSEAEGDGGPPGSGELILVVDDDDDARRSITKALRRSGWDVLETGEPERATRIVRGLDRPLDLVITDVLMPTMSGFRLADLLSGEHGPLRVLYISGYVRDEVEWSGAPGAVTGFLQKPVGLDELRRAVALILAETVAGKPAGGTRPATSDGGSDPRARVSTRPGGRDRDGDPSVGPVVVTSTSERGVRSLLVRLRHLGFDEIVELPLAGEGRTDVTEVPRLLVAWLDSAPDELIDERVDEVEALRARLAGTTTVPLLLLAETLPAGVTGRWADLFPALYLDTDATLAELGLHLEHLLAWHDTAREQRTARSEMEARVEAATAELRSAYGDLVMRLARTSELKDDATGRHGERVGETTRELAVEMGLPVERADVLAQAAQLHDLGKIAIPDAILDKPGELTPTERELVKRHTEVGADLLAGSRHPVLQEAETIARSHHERWDGSGYPDGLAGEEIPLGARIVAVADVFDVVTHARSYLEASSAERALGVVLEGRGTFFDPAVVDALESLDRRGRLSVDPDRGPVAPRDASPRSPIEIQALLEELDWS